MCDLILQPHLSQKYHCLLALIDASRPTEEVDEQGAREATTSKDHGDHGDQLEHCRALWGKHCNGAGENHLD